MAADLGAAQAAARAASASRTVTFNPAANSYTVSGVIAPDARSGTYTVVLSGPPYNAALGTISFTDNIADNQVKFDGYGAPDSGATIAVTAGGTTRTVTLDAATGSATVQ